jgi:exoribonuclease II
LLQRYVWDMRKVWIEKNMGKKIVAEKRIKVRKIEKGESQWKYATGEKSEVDDKGRMGERRINIRMVEWMIKVNIPPAKWMYVNVNGIFIFFQTHITFLNMFCWVETFHAIRKYSGVYFKSSVMLFTAHPPPATADWTTHGSFTGNNDGGESA